MNWLLIVLLILLIVIAIAWKILGPNFSLFGPKFKIVHIPSDGIGDLPENTRIRTVTFNIGLNKRTKDEWRNIIQNKWSVITNKDYDILFVALQESWNESSPYGQMGSAICELLQDSYECYIHTQDGPDDKWKKPFSVQNYVFARKGLSTGQPGIIRGSVCHAQTLGMCRKATVGLALEYANRKLVFMGSHLPVKPKADDFGYKERVKAARSAFDLLNKIKGDSNNVSVYWAGDMNFRRMAPADGINRDEQLKYLMEESPDKELFNDMHELDIDFPPTCRLIEITKQQGNSDEYHLRRNSMTKSANKDVILEKGDIAYDKKRVPSYCDRILTSQVRPTKYYSWTDGDAVDNSDHNVVILDSVV